MTMMMVLQGGSSINLLALLCCVIVGFLRVPQSDGQRARFVPTAAGGLKLIGLGPTPLDHQINSAPNTFGLPANSRQSRSPLVNSFQNPLQAPFQNQIHGFMARSNGFRRHDLMRQPMAKVGDPLIDPLLDMLVADLGLSPKSRQPFPSRAPLLNVNRRPFTSNRQFTPRIPKPDPTSRFAVTSGGKLRLLQDKPLPAPVPRKSRSNTRDLGLQSFNLIETPSKTVKKAGVKQSPDEISSLVALLLGEPLEVTTTTTTTTPAPQPTTPAPQPTTTTTETPILPMCTLPKDNQGLSDLLSAALGLGGMSGTKTDRATIQQNENQNKPKSDGLSDFLTAALLIGDTNSKKEAPVSSRKSKAAEEPKPDPMSSLLSAALAIGNPSTSEFSDTFLKDIQGVLLSGVQKMKKAPKQRSTVVPDVSKTDTPMEVTELPPTETTKKVKKTKKPKVKPVTEPTVEVTTPVPPPTTEAVTEPETTTTKRPKMKITTTTNEPEPTATSAPKPPKDTRKTTVSTTTNVTPISENLLKDIRGLVASATTTSKPKTTTAAPTTNITPISEGLWKDIRGIIGGAITPPVATTTPKSLMRSIVDTGETAPKPTEEPSTTKRPRRRNRRRRKPRKSPSAP
ncbi:unnamed protein product [Cyprideis torosa]|uniref:Uncharacterized protein n=1 Tax=Cyprideis torosa TaxID=163714 RepID=A0A7R8ZJK4_9CRUS|nr:unnamed protein product [Cyprideis torosa]CAG0888813.1 unnamed protein product [Cyprideis torosa]